MLSIMNNFKSKNRTLIFSFLLLIGLIIIDFFLTRFNIQEKKAQISLEIIQSDKILSSEVYRLLYSLEDDLSFIEKKIQIILTHNKQEKDINNLIDFLNTHAHYFKLRIATTDGEEIFKVVQNRETKQYEQSKSLYNLSGQDFFKELSQVKFDEFYFSSMEANIINGVPENPIRPAIRVSKRIKYQNDREALLVLNIDGSEIFQLFVGQTFDPTFATEKFLVDHKGFTVSSYPLLNEEEYTKKKVDISEKTFKVLSKKTVFQGSFTRKNDIFNFTRLPLPKSSGTWYLISTIPESSIKKAIYNQHLTRIFWEAAIYLILVFWFWRDDKKRHKEQVVQVLLKERSEFIQNVSHQLKTPLTIIHNYLAQPENIVENVPEMKKEVSHLIKVVEDFLLLGQIDSLQTIPLEKENILEILNETIELVGAKASKKSISIRLNLQEELTDALQALDKNVLPELLKSAFLNLLDNSIDFSPRNSTITVSISMSNTKVLIRFEDQGPGIDEKELPSLFERKMKVSTDPKRKGTGLGLAITKKILDLHQAEIHYVSNSKGACFHILI